MTALTDIDPGDILHQEDVYSTTAERYGYTVSHAETGDRSLYIKEGLERPQITGNLAADTVHDVAGIESPTTAYDDETDRLLIEDLGDLDHLHTEDSDTVDPDHVSLIDAVLGKYMVGDFDVIQNIVVDDEGTFYPIDFDQAGTRLGTAMEDRRHSVYEEAKRDINLAMTMLDGDRVSLGTVQTHAERLLNGLDAVDVETALQEHRYIEEGAAERYSENIQYMQEQLPP